PASRWSTRRRRPTPPSTRPAPGRPWPAPPGCNRRRPPRRRRHPDHVSPPSKPLARARAMGDGRRVGDEPGPRWIHRRGVVLAARFHPADGSPPRDALVRLSLTFGWPAPVPDFVGMGIRILPDGRDLLLASAGMDGDHRLTCSRDVLGCALASGLPCRVAG